MGYTSVIVNGIKGEVDNFLIQAELNEECSMQSAESQVAEAVSRLENIIENNENMLERKRKRQ